MAGTARLLTLKDMLAGSGCTPRTVRFYEREGLLRATRTRGGHRSFLPGELDRLNFILALREAGRSLEEITQLLGTRETTGDDREACKQLDQALGAQLSELDQKIEVLQRLRGDLEETRRALAVCRECTREGNRERPDPTRCATCSRLPEPAQLPRGFRLTWRGDV